MPVVNGGRGTTRTLVVRIVFVKQKYVVSGGGERYLDRLIRACLQREHEVHLVTTSWPASGEAGFHVHILPTRGLTRATCLRAFSEAAGARAAAIGADVTVSLERTAHQDVWRAGEGVHRVWMQRRRQFENPYRIALLERTSGHRAILELEAECVRNSRRIIANSRMVADDIRTVYGDAADKVDVIYNGADPARFNTQGREDDRRAVRARMGMADSVCLLLFVGSGFRRKGLGEALAALGGLPDCRLAVLGRDHAGPWARMARRLGVADRVAFLPPAQDLPALYHAADVLLLPSWFDPFPNVGLEALFCGTPVVTSRYAGIHELIVPHENGEVISSPSAIEELRAAVLAQRDLDRSGARAGRIAASVAAYTMNANVERTLSVLGCVEHA